MVQILFLGEEASDHLLNLSPFEMKTLLHHILSGKEFIIRAGKYVPDYILPPHFMYSLFYFVKKTISNIIVSFVYFSYS